MSEIFVIGHRNPDTDAICSAIGYAEFKRRTGMENAVAARCGDTNERIDFVLKSFGVPAPRFVPDVSPKVRDVMQQRVVSVAARSTVAEALELMDERALRVVPVLNDDHNCRGLVSLFKISKFFFASGSRLFDSRRVLTSVRRLARTLGGTMLFGIDAEKEEDLILMIGAMSEESFGKRLANYPPEKLVVVVGDRQSIQMRAIRGRVRVLVVTGGMPVDPDVFTEAKRHEVSLVQCPHDTATTAMLARSAVTVEHVLDEKFLTFGEDETLGAIQRLAAQSQFPAFPVVDADNRVVGILAKSDLLKPVDRQLILVDHNELSQAVIGADLVEIIEIIDHHRIGSLATPRPILFRNEPVGSTSTIVADCFFRYGVDLPQSIAGLLLAGLVSDTLNLTSPTTTARDAEILARLEQIAGVNAADFTDKLFASGSLLTSKPAPQAITTDCKEYEEAGRRFSVAQIEEIGFDQFWKRKQEVADALAAYRRSRNYYFATLLVTDVVMQTSLLLVSGPSEFIARIDHPKLEDGIYELAGIVSRKKQLLPYLTHTLALL
jgi:manganese-dependent inorganic pyrophosphatase